MNFSIFNIQIVKHSVFILLIFSCWWYWLDEPFLLFITGSIYLVNVGLALVFMMG